MTQAPLTPEAPELLGCPFCGGRDEVVVVHDAGFFWVECGRCLTMFQNAQRTPEAARALWNRRRADLPPPAPAPGWRVCEITWTFDHFGHTPLTTHNYQLWPCREPDDPEAVYWLPMGEREWRHAPSMEAAKAACQAHHDARIAACIETLPAPPGSPSPAPEERARILMEMVQADWDAGFFDLAPSQEPTPGMGGDDASNDA